MGDRMLQKLELLAGRLEGERNSNVLAKTEWVGWRVSEADRKEMPVMAGVHMHRLYLVHVRFQCAFVLPDFPIEEWVVGIK